LNLLDELKDIPIYRTKYIEPTLRGLQMWLTGKDRTYKTLKKEDTFKTHERKEIEKINSIEKVSSFQIVYNYFLDHYLKKPDRFWTWKKSAIKKAKQLIKDENIGFIYTTSGPYTNGEIGFSLKKSFQIKWIADFRDPQLSVFRNHSNIKNILKKQRKIKVRIIKNADKTVTASYAHKLMLLSQYEILNENKVDFIPTGLDNDYLPSSSKHSIGKKNYIVFVGEYLKEYGDYFFKIFSQLETKITIKIVGNIDINKSILQNYIAIYDLKNNIEFIDHLPQKDLYEIINNARAGLLIPDSLWWCSFAKMVDYIALQVPVIAKVPELSEAKLQLTTAGLGVFLTGKEKNDIKTLDFFFSSSKPLIQANDYYCKRYLATAQVKAFIEVFKKL
jgi:glycosyltransferase involved in cell wall biosynthesis